MTTTTHLGQIHAKHRFRTEFPVQGTATFVYPVLSAEEYRSPAFDAHFDFYASDIEIAVKDRDWSCWAVKDTGRNASWTIVPTGEPPDQDGKLLYNITVTFAINATAFAIGETDVVPAPGTPEFETATEQAGAAIRTAWFDQFPSMPRPA
jgi:hypothetical protein